MNLTLTLFQDVKAKFETNLQAPNAQEVAKVRERLETQEKRVRDLQRTIASQLERTNEVEKTQQTFAKQDDFKRLEREIISIKDKQFNLEGQLRRVESKIQSGGSTGTSEGENSHS